MKIFSYLLLYCFLFFNAYAKDKIRVCFASDDKFMYPTTVAIASILKNANEDDNLHFYIIDMGISKESKEKFLDLRKIKSFEHTFLNIKDGRIKQIPIDRREKSQILGHTTYGRIFLCDLLPKIDKILYLDGDIVVRKSLKKLWETDIKKYYLAGAKDLVLTFGRSDYIKKIMSYKNNKSNFYFNAGVLLMNLKKFRDDKILERVFERVFELSKIRYLEFDDQDVLNSLVGDSAKILDIKFNYLSAYGNNTKNEMLKSYIVHFAGQYNKPWNWIDIIYELQIVQEYFDALKLTKYWTFKEKMREFWLFYIWFPIIKASIFINKVLKKL